MSSPTNTSPTSSINRSLQRQATSDVPSGLQSRSSSTAQINITSWRKGELLGKGSFGEVYKGLDLTSSLIFAVKTLHLDKGSRAAIEKEISILTKLSHPNLVKYYGCASEEETIHIFMEYLAGGSVKGTLEAFGTLPESLVKKYTFQTLNALQYIHSQSTVHRDVKPANLLLSPTGEVKLADFGCAKILTDTATSTKNVAGSPAYMAPESMMGKIGCPSDVWSVGCTVVELITGNPPYADRNFENPLQVMFFVAQGGSPDIPEDISPEMTEFLKHCFVHDASKRMTCEELLRLPWFDNTGEEDDSTVVGAGSPPWIAVHDVFLHIVRYLSVSDVCTFSMTNHLIHRLTVSTTGIWFERLPIRDPEVPFTARLFITRREGRLTLCDMYSLTDPRLVGLAALSYERQPHRMLRRYPEPPEGTFPYPGLRMEVLDTVSKWYQATILQTRESGEVLVHYESWGNKWDEWINFNESRHRFRDLGSVPIPYFHKNRSVRAYATDLTFVAAETRDFLDQHVLREILDQIITYRPTTTSPYVLENMSQTGSNGNFMESHLVDHTHLISPVVEFQTQNIIDILNDASECVFVMCSGYEPFKKKSCSIVCVQRTAGAKGLNWNAY